MKRQHPENSDMFWCSDCKKYHVSDEFYVDKRWNRPQSVCKKALKKRTEIRREANYSAWLKYNRLWSKANSYKWRKSHQREAKEYSKRQWKRAIDGLSDYYIKDLLRRQGLAITGDTIEMKRQLLTKKRLIKEVMNELTGNRDQGN